MEWEKHKAGYVSIIGLPNVGKSTLLNSLLDTKLSIVSHKAQTTRHRILGFLNGDDYQIVFSDTPGFVRESSYKMHESMNRSVRETFSDADLVLLLVEPGMKAESIADLLQVLKKSSIPALLIINKADKFQSQSEAEECRKYWSEIMGPECPILFLSALTNNGKDNLIQQIAASLPNHPPYFDKEDLSDRNTRFFASEIIREKIFHLFDKEIPYACQVEVEDFKEKELVYVITAVIYVERNSQKPILLGKKGEMIKKLGTEARKSLQEFLDHPVYLDLTIKVRENWRNDPNALKRFGYEA